MRLLMSGLVRRHRCSEFRNCDISGFVRPSNFNFNEISKWKETNIKAAVLVRGYNHPQRYVSLVPLGQKKKKSVTNVSLSLSLRDGNCLDV